MTNYRQLIKNWHSKASDDDYFSKFVFEYLAFTALLHTQIYSNGNQSERVVLQKLKNDTRVKEYYFSNSDITASYNTLKQELNIYRLGNASGLADVEEIEWWNHHCLSDNACSKKKSVCGGDDEVDYKMESDDTKGKLYGNKDWANLIELWSVVRNNLFHGSKDPDNARDKLMVEHGFKTLQPLVEILINKSYD